MKRLLAVLFSVQLAFGYPWTGIIDSTRAIDWSLAGAGSLTSPARTQCAGSPISAYDGTAATINTAIANCTATAGAPKYVLLGAGTFNLTTGIIFNFKSYVTIRGSGPDATFLTFTGVDPCGGQHSVICVINGYIIDNPESEGSNASWTAGYSPGTTSITIGPIGGIGTKPVVGTLIQLAQTNDNTTDTGDIYVCTTAGTCTQSGGYHGQQQLVTVTAITGDATCSANCTVTITPGLYMPNWRSGKSPKAWWTGNQASNAVPITGVGIEDLSIDASALVTSSNPNTIAFLWATYSWIKNIRMIRHASETVPVGNAKLIKMMLSAHITIRDSYFFGRQNHDDYGIDCYRCGDNLVENNIFHHLPLPMQHETEHGSVYAYNFAINNIWGSDTYPGVWAQGSNSYHGTEGNSYYMLDEGNDGHGWEMDNVFTPGQFLTGFRNRWFGWETGQVDQTNAVLIAGLNRYINVIGNVLGSTALPHNRYETKTGDSFTYSNCTHSVYSIGLGGNCASGSGPTADTLTVTSLMRWGNYDTVNDAVRFVNGEVPNGISPYGNSIPASQTLPASFYLSSKPAWFGTHTYPPIGPDVTGGDIANAGGHAFRIPARICFEDVMGGTYSDTSARTFNASSCYASGSGTGGSLGGGRTLSGGRASNN